MGKRTYNTAKANNDTGMDMSVGRKRTEGAREDSPLKEVT